MSAHLHTSMIIIIFPLTPPFPTQYNNRILFIRTYYETMKKKRK